MKLKSLLLLTFCYSQLASSQVLNLDSCINYALNHHPIVKSKQKEIERKGYEKKAIFNPDPLQFSYANGNINSGMVDYAFDVSQSFDFPTEYISLKRLKEQEIELSQNEFLIQQATIRKEIKSAYNTLLLYKNNLVLLERFSTHLQRFESEAQRHQKNDSSLASLEYTSAQARHQEILVSIAQEKLKIEQAKNNLRSWTSNFELQDIPDSLITKTIEVNIKSEFTSPYEKLQTSILGI